VRDLPAQRRVLIIDTDPGVDDAIAILLALASPELEPLGLTTVLGNVSLALATDNARRICELAGRPDLPIVVGAARPLKGSPIAAEPSHGSTGLGGATLPQPTMTLAAGDAVDWLIDTVMRRAAGTVTVAALAPLTNLAKAMVMEPRIVPRLGGIVVMGGAFATGNCPGGAEFNFYADAEAAQRVVASGCRLTLVPLDLTHQALATPARLAALAAIAAPIGPAVAAMLRYYSDAALPFGLAGGALHDACVIAYLLRPDLFTGRPAHIRVETGAARIGVTVEDRRPAAAAAPNCLIIEQLDADGFFALLTERLARLAVV
jgi:purine nucleosidase